MVNKQHPRQGLGFVRLMLVLSSLCPLFLLWAIRGTKLVPDIYFVAFCLLMALIPTLLLLCRFRVAINNSDEKDINIEEWNDHRVQVLTYLFAMLLPFYREELSTCRDMLAMAAALLFIIVLFYRLNLLYINFLFILFGYRIYEVPPSQSNKENPYARKEPIILITKRRSLPAVKIVKTLRIVDFVYLEKNK